MINYKKLQLKNGIKVITAPMKETKAVTVLFLIRAGSRAETKEKNGIFHFIEHMLFKGTAKRPTSLHISQELDAVGADYNAFTSDEYTGFYISCEASHFDMALDVLIDILFNSKFDQKEIKKEKGVILEEINMYLDLPQKYIQDLAKKQLFGDTSLGRATLGVPKTVSNFARQDFINYIGKYYQPNTMMIAVAGREEKSDWINQIKKQLNKYNGRAMNNFEKNVFVQSKPTTLIHSRKTDQAHLAISWRAFGRFDHRRWALKVLNNILGETMSSRLFSEVREKRGLAYYVGSANWEFADCGAQVAYAGLDIKRINPAITVIMQEYQKLIKQKVTTAEINRAKENIKGRMYLGLEDSSSIADFLLEQQLLFDDILQPEEIIKKIFAVTPSDIQNVAKEIFTPRNFNLTVIGPFEDKNMFDKIIKF